MLLLFIESVIENETSHLFISLGIQIHYLPSNKGVFPQKQLLLLSCYKMLNPSPIC